MVPDTPLRLSRMTIAHIPLSKSKMASWLWKGNICIMYLENWCMTSTGHNSSKEPHTWKSTIPLNYMSKVPTSTEPSKAHKLTCLDCYKNYLHRCYQLSKWTMRCHPWPSKKVILRMSRMTQLLKFMEESIQISIWFLFTQKSKHSCLQVPPTNTGLILTMKETFLWSTRNKIVLTRSFGANKI